MSILYKALIKEQNQDHNTANEQGYSLSSYAGSSSSQPSSTGLWITIAFLLLIIGLLGGYLLANHQTDSTPSIPAQKPFPTEQPKTRAVMASASSIDNKQTAADTLNTANSIPPIDSSPSSNLKAQQAKSIAAVLETSTTENDMPVASNELLTFEAPESYEEALKDIPEELKNRFADAVEATNKDTRIQQSSVSSSSSLLSISELPPTEQALVPNILYQMHIYASEPSERWIKINGYTIYEGEPLTKNVVLEEIRLNESVWLVNGKRVSLSALQDFRAKKR
jgi:hypothetical protein